MAGTLHRTRRPYRFGHRSRLSFIAVAIDGGTGTNSGRDTRTTAAAEHGDASTETTSTTGTTVAAQTSATPETQDVHSNGQPRFGFVVAVIALVLLARERQRL
ncbi:hypothetical protein [Haladaptatus sp. DFWS20]|uniref:hypothetical protein n=1 Tax=Haladaptatus sp. DFWS20 TaxID=3403467 RepID=UPI003EBF1C53